MRSPAPQIVPLNWPGLDRAAALANRAFFNDPFLECILPDRRRRERIGPRLFRAAIRFGLRYGEVLTTPGVEGVAVWCAPGRGETTLWRMFRSGFLGVYLRMRAGERARFDRLLAVQREIRAAALPGPHSYLFMLAVDPAAQGRGLGGTLLRACLARSSAEGVPCYLETSNPVNVTFYEKHGFHAALERDTMEGGPRIWGMVRG